MALPLNFQVHNAESLDLLYEAVEEDIRSYYEDEEIKDYYEKCNELVHELCDTGYIEAIRCSDDTLQYKAKTGIKWSNIVDLSDPIKKKILKQLIPNPKCFFVLFNTQRGKLRIIGQEIASWIDLQQQRVVSYLVVSNDRTLSEQSKNGLFSCFPLRQGCENKPNPEPDDYKVKIFELSSNNKTSLIDILIYIDAYAHMPSYDMPLIVLLANNKQIEKLIKILNHIINHPHPQLRAGGAWDEADQTYPPFREKNVIIKDQSLNFCQLLNHPSERIIRNGFVTATEGSLLDEVDEYEECTNAYHYNVPIDPKDKDNYVSFNHVESTKHIITVHPRELNNIIATRVLNENWEHFTTPFILRDGTSYHHKLIVNADSTSAEMARFAKSFIDRAHIMTFNMYGIQLYNTQFPNGKKYFTRKQNLNELLFYIYKKNHLDDKPLIIVGRRKVDRGLGFHYAPRNGRTPKLLFDSKKNKAYIDGDLHTDGIEGLIWTDMCMGNRIVHVPTAAQKAGRLQGIIRQCPQYPGELHYWIEANTARIIEHHCNKVDAVNELSGSNSIKQAVERVEASIPKIRLPNHSVDVKTFRVVQGENAVDTLDITKRIITEIFEKSFRNPQKDKSGKYKTSLNSVSGVVKLLEAVNAVPGAYGTDPKDKDKPKDKRNKIYRRYFPCYADDDSLCCVIPLIDESYTSIMIETLDREFGSNCVSVPQEGDY